MFRKLIHGSVAAFAFAALSLGAVQANATTVDFEIKNLSTTLASGWFSYSAPNPVVLGYDDLDDFEIMIGANTYDLAFVTSATHDACEYFAYDTASNALVPGAASAACFNIALVLGSGNGSFTEGFVFRANELQYTVFPDGPFNASFDTVTVTPKVPEPAALALFGLGLVGLGFARRRRMFA